MKTESLPLWFYIAFIVSIIGICIFGDQIFSQVGGL